MSEPHENESEFGYKEPIPLWATKPAVMEFAEKQRNAVGLKNGFQLPALINSNGGEIQYIGFFDADQTDAIKVEPNGDFKIVLSSHTSELRDNFTIAHELGHKLLHWPLVKDKYPGFGMRATRRVDEQDKALQRCEWEANWFASAFLMPKEQFTVAFHEGTASERFGVTKAAVMVRAKSLGLIN